MASIYSTSAGKWVVQWSAGRDRHGKTIRDSRTFSDYERAIAHKVEVETRNAGTGKDSLTSRALQWIEDRQAIGKIGAKTAKGYEEKLTAWGNLLGSGPYKKLAARDIQRAYGRIAKGDTPTGRVPSPRTLNHYKASLRAFFNAMERAGEISFNPTRALESPNGLRDKTRRAPTRDELARILETADGSRSAFGQMGMILRVASHIGLRRGEIAALKWSDLDMPAMRVTVRRAATQPDGRAVYLKEPKSDAGWRTIAMLQPTIDLLNEQRKRVNEWRLKAGRSWADNDFVFPSPLGEILDLEELTRSAGRIRNRAGVSADVSPIHGTRHYNLTEMHRAGVDSVTLQARAGHADIRSTAGYITIDEDKDRKAAEAAKGALL